MYYQTRSRNCHNLSVLSTFRSKNKKLSHVRSTSSPFGLESTGLWSAQLARAKPISRREDSWNTYVACFHMHAGTCWTPVPMRISQDTSMNRVCMKASRYRHYWTLLYIQAYGRRMSTSRSIMNLTWMLYSGVVSLQSSSSTSLLTLSDMLKLQNPPTPTFDLLSKDESIRLPSLRARNPYRGFLKPCLAR